MTSPELKAGFCQDVVTLQKLGIRILVVHGGGPQINAMLDKVGVESRFEGGMRVSSKEVVDVAEMVLCGSVNKEISSTICSFGGRALGLSGRDDSLLQCVKKINKDGYDLEYVGEVETVNTDLLNDLLDMGICPVVSPIGTGIGEEKDIAYNVNADVAAGRIAGELKAARVLFLTDIAGVLDKEMKLLPSLSCADVESLIDDETITGGMIPKVSVRTLMVSLLEFPILPKITLAFDDSQSLTFFFTFVSLDSTPPARSNWVLEVPSSQMEESLTRYSKKYWQEVLTEVDLEKEVLLSVNK